MAEEDKVTDTRKAEQMRRTELAMLGLLIEKYPREAKEKTHRLEHKKPCQNLGQYSNS